MHLTLTDAFSCLSGTSLSHLKWDATLSTGINTELSVFLWWVSLGPKRFLFRPCTSYHSSFLAFYIHMTATKYMLECFCFSFPWYWCSRLWSNRWLKERCSGRHLRPGSSGQSGQSGHETTARSTSATRSQGLLHIRYRIPLAVVLLFSKRWGSYSKDTVSK